MRAKTSPTARANLRAVDPSGPVPLHAQIERELRRMIALPEFQKGGWLPDELTLANRFGVSRGTVRAPLARLVDQRLLERRRGVGTRVRPVPAESSISAWRSFSQEMAHRQIVVECFHRDVRQVAAPATVARELQIEERTPVLRLDRVRGWDGRPVLHSRSWIHPRLPITAMADFSRPLYALIQEETGAVAEGAREEFSAVQAPAALARHLRVKTGAPLLERRHTVTDRGGRPIEHAEIHYVSARFTLTLDLQKTLE